MGWWPLVYIFPCYKNICLLITLLQKYRKWVDGLEDIFISFWLVYDYDFKPSYMLLKMQFNYYNYHSAYEGRVHFFKKKSQACSVSLQSTSKNVSHSLCLFSHSEFGGGKWRGLCLRGIFASTLVFCWRTHLENCRKRFPFLYWITSTPQ